MSQDRQAATAKGPLAGVRIVEFAGLGPGPFACMLLSDMGADVVRIDRPGASLGNRFDIVGRGRRTVLLDLKNPQARLEAQNILRHADVLVEGFRPGVMERLGLGPDGVSALNPKLVYGRMTGWGQQGPLAQAAGHDINYIATSGALAAIGPRDGPPIVPLNLVGDYGGGSMYLVAGILAALLEARVSGRGQVVDAAICDGVFSLMSTAVGHGLRGLHSERRGSNPLDGGAPYYAVYETSDGQYVSVGAIEPQFFSLLCDTIGVSPSLRDAQHDKTRWPALRDEMARIFAQRSRDEWTRFLEGTDTCFAPVLSLSEAAEHAHNTARGAFVDIAGVSHPAPAPRFSRTASTIQGAAPAQAVTAEEVVAAWGQARV
jgi:alpha-methylacyl-CoA racemase